MKFLDLFGKTRTHHVRQVRAPPRPDLSAEQRHSTARKIDTIESEIASEIESALTAATPDAATLLHQRIEEACLLHASGQSATAAALLAEATATPVPQDAPAERRAWLMQLELAGFAGLQDRFEDIALDYARRFETSPPQWRSLQAQDEVDEAALHAVSFRGRLCGSAAPALVRLEQITSRQNRFRLDLGGVTDVDADGCRLLLDMLRRWRSEGRDGEFAGIEGLLTLLRAQTGDGRRDPDDAAWLLLIELLRASGRAREHEEACLSYSLTYEVSPPAAPAAPARKEKAPAPAGHLVLPPEIGFPVDELLESLRAAERGASALVLDCRRLRRIEFAAAAPMLAGILRLARGKPVEWRDVPFLVSTLLQLVGGDATSKIINRQP